MFDWCIVVDGLQLSTTKVLPSKKLKNKQTNKKETKYDVSIVVAHDKTLTCRVALRFTEGHSHSSLTYI